MKSKYLKFLLLSAVISTSQIKTADAQGVCGTVQKNEELFLKNPALRQAYIDYNNELNQKVNQKESRTTTLYTIPIVFHVIHVNGVENISDANIIAQVARLNTDFRKLNSDITSAPPYFQSIAGDALIQFKLAQIDPNGNCTNGIERIYSHKTFKADDYSKLNQWPRDKYFNVWVITDIGATTAGGIILAYATFPSSVATWGYPSDGVIMRSDQCNGTSRTLTHETGHWLGLEHTWGNTEVATVCGDDNVTDTPITKGHFSTCPAYDFSCDNLAVTGAYAFSAVTTSSGSSDPTSAPSVADSTLTFSNFSSVGVSSNSSSAAMFDYSNWDIGALNGETNYSLLTGTVNTGKYYQFTVTPDPNVLMSLTSLTFDFKRDTAGIRTFVVRSSADGYTSNLAASILPANPNLSVQTGNVFFCNSDTTINLVGSKITLSGAAFTGTSNPITFRIYGYNAESATGTFGIDNLSITGTYGDAENINNYMDYSSCIYMFTQGQVDRMRTVVESSVAQRSSLWINSNLIATGTDGTVLPPCVPNPDFYANKYSVCPGGNITFTKNVLNGTATSWSWSFDVGTGTPVISTLPNPVITYNIPGSYNVSLTATNASGTATVTKNLFIDVNDAYAQVPSTYSEGFENTTNFYNYWSINDMDGNAKTWWLNSSAAYSGSRSIRMNAFYNYAYDVDQLLSPSYNLMYLTSPVLTFRCAAATQATVASDLNDNLRVWVSKDCGVTWYSILNLTGTAFINNGYHPEEFVPNSPSQWALKTTAVIPATYVTGNTKFKFEYTSGFAGNSIYIDDINITGVLGVDENSVDNANVSIYPNPANQTSTLAYHLNAKGDVKIEVIDVLGKKIMEVNNNDQAEGDHSIQISKQELNLINGIYFVKFTIGNNTITKKLIISE